MLLVVHFIFNFTSDQASFFVISRIKKMKIMQHQEEFEASLVTITMSDVLAFKSKFEVEIRLFWQIDAVRQNCRVNGNYAIAVEIV
jgi:hypothetical protein